MKGRSARNAMSDPMGTTYLLAMFAIVLIGLSVSGAAEQWKTIGAREKEAELLYRGDQFRQAIQAYYKSVPGGRFPQKLDELIKPKRYLRRIYKDPITNDEFVPLLNEAGRVMGVRSSSQEKPLKTANFPPQYAFFAGAQSYADWVFQHIPPPPPQQPPAQGGPKPGGTRP